MLRVAIRYVLWRNKIFYAALSPRIMITSKGDFGEMQEKILEDGECGAG